MKYVGKVIALLGILTVFAAFGSLGGDLPATSKVVRFLWILCVGVGLIGAGCVLMRKTRA